MKVHILALISAAFTLNACTSIEPYNPPCYEGWSVNQFGTSSIVPIESLDPSVLKLVGSGENIQCAHAIPGQGLLLIVSAQNTFETISIANDNGIYSVVERGFLVRADR